MSNQELSSYVFSKVIECLKHFYAFFWELETLPMHQSKTYWLTNTMENYWRKDDMKLLHSTPNQNFGLFYGCLTLCQNVIEWLPYTSTV